MDWSRVSRDAAGKVKSWFVPMTASKAKIWAVILVLVIIGAVYGKDIKNVWVYFASLKHWWLDLGPLYIYFSYSMNTMSDV